MTPCECTRKNDGEGWSKGARSAQSGHVSHSSPKQPATWYLIECFPPSRRTGSQHTRSRTTLGKTKCNPRTLGVLCPLLVVEGRGAHPRTSENRKQVWVCRADAGVCHVWKVTGEPSNICKYAYQACHLREAGWHMSLGDRDAQHMGGARVHSTVARAGSPYSTLAVWPVCPHTRG